MKKGTMSTQELIGVKNFSRNGIQTNGHGEVVYFMISPTNISVLSRAAIGQKIKSLMELIMAEPNIEVICMDARENFDENKIYLDERIEDEPNGKIRELLMRDKAFLDDIQVQMSTSREFLIAYRLRNESDEQSFSVLNRVEKCINEQGFNCNRCEKDDVKRILARHCGITTDDTPIADTDGEETVSKWIIPD